VNFAALLKFYELLWQEMQVIFPRFGDTNQLQPTAEARHIDARRLTINRK